MAFRHEQTIKHCKQCSVIGNEVQNSEISHNRVSDSIRHQICMSNISLVQFLAAMFGQIRAIFITWFVNEYPESAFGIGFRINTGAGAEVEYRSAIRCKLIYKVLKMPADIEVSRGSKHEVMISLAAMHDCPPQVPSPYNIRQPHQWVEIFRIWP